MAMFLKLCACQLGRNYCEALLAKVTDERPYAPELFSVVGGQHLPLDPEKDSFSYDEIEKACRDGKSSDNGYWRCRYADEIAYPAEVVETERAVA